MHFSENDLRSALRRKDPGDAFTQRVMARINQAKERASEPRQQRQRDIRQPWRPWPWKGALAGVLTVTLVFAGWLGFMHHRQNEERQAGEAAKQQAILALRITTAKLNHVFERVKASPSREVKIRRESL